MAIISAFRSGCFRISISPAPARLSCKSPRRETSCRCSCIRDGDAYSWQTSTLQAIQKSGVIACVRTQSGKVALEAAHIALHEGISVLEITMTTPNALQVIAELVQEYPSAVIGAGTVLTLEDAKNAEMAGVKFVMSPTMVKEILEDYKDAPVLYIPGAMTPSEVLNAHASGARIIKIYPVRLLGGERYIQALRRPFHHIHMVASQGIAIDDVEVYISEGASAVVLSDAIFDKTALLERNFNIIKKLACLAALKGKTAVERCFSSST